MDEIKIESYGDLKNIADEFVAGSLRNVMVVGTPGTMKTTTICNRMPELTVRECGQVSPFELYQRLFWIRNQLLVLDDVEEFLARTAGQELIRSLTESVEKKTLQWRTKGMVKAGVPTSFRTTTRCFVIANRLGTTGIWTALRSRCHVFRYEPSWEEFLYTIGEIGNLQIDQEVLDYAYENRGLIGTPDIRRLIKAQELKDSPLEGLWKKSLGQFSEGTSRRESNTNERRTKVFELLNDQSFASMDDRIAAFQADGFGSRATFFKYAGEIRRSERSGQLRAAG